MVSPVSVVSRVSVVSVVSLVCVVSVGSGAEGDDASDEHAASVTSMSATNTAAEKADVKWNFGRDVSAGISTLRWLISMIDKLRFVPVTLGGLPDRISDQVVASEGGCCIA